MMPNGGSGVGVDMVARAWGSSECSEGASRGETVDVGDNDTENT